MALTDSPKPPGSREFNAMKAVTAALTAIPVLSGLTGIVGGPAVLAGDSRPPDPSTDSEFRFLSAAWFAFGPLTWTALPVAHTRPLLLRIIGAGIILGGMARVRSWRRVGRPQSLMVAGAGLELVGVPLLLGWHARIVRQFNAESSSARSDPYWFAWHERNAAPGEMRC